MSSCRYKAALLACLFTSAFSLSVPIGQQITTNDASSIVYPATSTILTLPPSIPGFEVRLLFDPSPTLLLWQVYSNAIELISKLAQGDLGHWDQLVPQPIYVTSRHYQAVIRVQSWPASAGASELRFKHAIRAVFEAGVALAAKPITNPGYVPRLHAGPFLQNRQIGLLQWARTLGSEANATLGVVDVGNSTGVLQLEAADSDRALQLVHGEGSVSVNADGGTYVDPDDPRYRVTYAVSGGNVMGRDIFSAFLEAMATAAPNDPLATGAFVNAVGVSGEIAVNMHGTGIPSALTWRRLVRTMTMVWEQIVENHHWKEMDWTVLFNEVEVGQGYIFNINSPH